MTTFNDLMTDWENCDQFLGLRESKVSIKSHWKPCFKDNKIVDLIYMLERYKDRLVLKWHNPASFRVVCENDRVLTLEEQDQYIKAFQPFFTPKRYQNRPAIPEECFGCRNCEYCAQFIDDDDNNKHLNEQQ